jgi:hypothetical protein
MMNRPRLNALDLAKAWDDAPSPTMRKVLWEVAYLRAMVKRAAYIRNAIGDTCPRGVESFMWTVFCNEIDREPCVTDTERTPRSVARTKAYMERMRAEERARE